MSSPRLQGHFQIDDGLCSTPAQPHEIRPDTASHCAAPRRASTIASPSLTELRASRAPSRPARIADNELAVAAYIVGRNRINGTPAADEQVQKLRIGQTIIDKTRQRLAFGRGNIHEDYDSKGFDPYVRTQVSRTMANIMGSVLVDALIHNKFPTDDKTHYLNCIPADFSSRLQTSLLTDENQYLANHIKQICSLAVSRFVGAGNCGEHAQEAAAIGGKDAFILNSKINQTALLVEAPPEKLDHAWSEIRTRPQPRDGLAFLPENNVFSPQNDDVIVDAWVNGPPVFREDSRYASAKPEEFKLSYIPPIVDQLAWEVEMAMNNSESIKLDFYTLYFQHQQQLPNPSQFYGEPPSINDEYEDSYVNKVDNSPRITGHAPLEELQLEVAAVQVNRAFGLPLSAAMKKENVTRITRKFDELLESIGPESDDDSDNGSADGTRPRAFEPMQRD
ncbi:MULTISPECIES: hypothetical protein [Burkholderiaceae]|uniref:hypothetical protein n=1 Tax=Burkholderiaceae TaxID=119060 RepID=UPI000962A8A8|nr:MULTISPECIES: hypothetical protein [Burkholderiaceae]MCG1018149.1 hypothetical protein [Mycetohabitans sp. B4]SIT67309.1 hypothetical protein SAMN04487768_1119 [Burkholderia sp. b13]